MRFSLFPLALQALDPFAWTCAGNSLIFATVVTTIATTMGVGLGWLLARLRFRGRSIPKAAAVSLLAASPVVLALGLSEILHSWPSVISALGGDRQ